MIRRSVPIGLLLLACSSCLFGQRPSSFGLKGGVALANQSYRITAIDQELETEALTGPTLSLFVEAFKSPHFSVQLDVGYAAKGSTTTTRSVTVNHLENDRITINEGEAVRSDFTYLSLVPLARYRWDIEPLCPYLLLGPRVDFLLRYSTESEYPLEQQNQAILGLSMGGGLEYKWQNLGLFAELQYLPDLSPVSRVEPLLINNNMLSLCLGIRWIVSGE
jgi:hypothetical protein